MRFTLFYRGLLKSNADAGTKHELRQHFHQQLLTALKNSPLFQFNSYALDPYIWFSELNTKQIGSHKFLPLAGDHVVGVDTTKRIGSTVELDITLLQAGRLGSVITKGADIDNRLKTLFDALQIPDSNQIKCIVQADTNTVMCCLMADDKLVTDVRVSIAQLLDVEDRSSEVVVLIAVVIHGGLSRNRPDS